MSRRASVLLFVLLSALLCVAAERKAYILNYKRIGSADLAITCANGGDPTGTKVGDALIISCGK